MSERPTRETAICPRRLRRAATLTADRFGLGEYVVQGSSGKRYTVNLNGDQLCECADHYHRGIQCAHVLYARMREGDVKVLQALGDMLLQAQKNLLEYVKSKHTRARRKAS